MKIFVENYKGLEIYFEALNEDIPLYHLFEKEDLNEIIEKIDNYDLVYFCAKVTAYFNDIELASDYLGGCLYENEKEFYTKYKNEYYSDMREMVYKESITQLKELKESINQFI